MSGKLGFVSLQFDFIYLFQILQHFHWLSGRRWEAWRRKKTMIWLRGFSHIPQNYRSLLNQKPQCSLKRTASLADCIQNRTYPIYLRWVHQSRPFWGCGVYYETLIWPLLILQSIQAVLSGLTMKDLFSFKMCLLNSKKDKTLQQVTEGDILDFVDKMLEVFGNNPFSFHNKHITLNERGTSIGLKVAPLSGNDFVQDKIIPCCTPSTLYKISKRKQKQKNYVIAVKEVG